MKISSYDKYHSTSRPIPNTQQTPCVTFPATRPTHISHDQNNPPPKPSIATEGIISTYDEMGQVFEPLKFNPALRFTREKLQINFE